MKVGFNVNRVINSYKQNTNVNQVNKVKKDKGDKIDISNESIEIRKYIESAENIEIKNQRADEIKALIAQNKYKVDTDKLAKSILKHMKESDV